MKNQLIEDSNEEAVQNINGTWSLTKFHKNNISIDRSDPKFIPSLMVDQDEMKIGGRDGCNQIFASLSKLDSEEITIGIIGGTKMSCKMKISYDTDYRNFLRATKKYKIDNTYLILLDAEDNKLLEFKRNNI